MTISAQEINVDTDCYIIHCENGNQIMFAAKTLSTPFDKKGYVLINGHHIDLDSCTQPIEFWEGNPQKYFDAPVIPYNEWSKLLDNQSSIRWRK